MLELARDLVSALEEGDDHGAENILHRLTSERELGLLVDIRKLTGALHSALLNVQHFNQNVDSRISGIAKYDIPDVRARLYYVLSKTEQAAHQTLSAIEHLLPIADNISVSVNELREGCSKHGLMNAQRNSGGVVTASLETYFKKLISDSRIIHAKLSEVLMAQDYQDLTGQVIRRVIDVFQEVEEELDSLVQDVGVHRCAGIQADSGPRPNYHGIARRRDDDRVADQNEVDSLLSSLGISAPPET